MKSKRNSKNSNKKGAKPAKRSRRQKAKSSSINTKGKISFQKKSSIKPSITAIKRTAIKKGKKTKRRSVNKTKSIIKKILQLLGILIFIIILIGLVYIAILKVLDIRKISSYSEIDLTKTVYAIDNVPQYPGSEFIYKNLLDNETVKKTLSSGISAYRLPPYKQIDDVYKFYKKQLPDFGWNFAQYVPLASPTMYSGQYWTNKNGGLRIYTRLNDIWYEKITIEEAKNGLEARKLDVIEREKVLAQDEDQLLLPGFAWQLKLSNEYILDYFSTEYNDAIGVIMKHLVTSRVTILGPIGISSEAPEDTQIENYLKIYNDLNEDENWEIVNSLYINKGTLDALQVSLINGSETTTAYVLNNKLDNNAYILVSFDNDTEFVDYILANLIDKSTLTVNTHLKIY